VRGWGWVERAAAIFALMPRGAAELVWCCGVRVHGGKINPALDKRNSFLELFSLLTIKRWFMVRLQ